MKKIIEETLEKGANPYEAILKYVQQGAWVWISKRLYRELSTLYHYQEYRCAYPNGKIFYIREDGYDERWHEIKGLTLSITEGFTWNKVSHISGLLEKDNPESKSPYSKSDPDLLVFLS